VKDLAVARCEKTLAGDSKKPLADRVTEMLSAFAEYGVDQQMMEDRLGHKISATIETELVAMQKIFISLKDGMADRDQYFKVPKTDSQEMEDLNDRVAGLEKKKASKTEVPAEKVTPIKKAKPKAKTKTKAELGEYMATFGRLTGQKLQDVPTVVLESMTNTLMKAETKSPEVMELLEKIQEFLKA